MTNREFNELKAKLELATPREIAQIFAAMGKKDPFKINGNHLLLPSAVKTECIKQIEKWFREGKLTAQKDA